MVLSALLLLIGQPTLEPPKDITIPEYSFGVVEVKGTFKHVAYDIPKPLQRTSCADKLEFTGPPGEYTIRICASDETGITPIYTVKVKIEGKVPVPVEPDKPKPPVVVDKYDKIYVAIVEESQYRTPEIAEILDRQHEWRKVPGTGGVVTYDRSLPDSQPYVNLVGETDWKIPTVIVLSPAGKTITKLPLNKYSHADTVKKYVK